MAEQILQVNFTLNVSPPEYRELAAGVADAFATLPGLRWKVWLLNEQTGEAGGVYLFESAEALKAFTDGQLAATVASHPAFKGFTAKVYDVMPDVTALTRGPVGAAATA